MTQTQRWRFAISRETGARFTSGGWFTVGGQLGLLFLLLLFFVQLACPPGPSSEVRRAAARRASADAGASASARRRPPPQVRGRAALLAPVIKADGVGEMVIGKAIPARYLLAAAAPEEVPLGGGGA